MTIKKKERTINKDNIDKAVSLRLKKTKNDNIELLSYCDDCIVEDCKFYKILTQLIGIYKFQISIVCPFKVIDPNE